MLGKVYSLFEVVQEISILLLIVVFHLFNAFLVYYVMQFSYTYYVIAMLKVS